jgi:predicted nucleotidyltransferase
MVSLVERQKKREERRKALERNCYLIVEQLKALGALKVIIFGSFVRGEIGLWSDLDLIAVMPSLLSGKEWRRKIQAEIDREIACDIIVYNEKELEESIPISSFLRHALKEGRVIYEKKP